MNMNDSEKRITQLDMSLIVLVLAMVTIVTIVAVIIERFFSCCISDEIRMPLKNIVLLIPLFRSSLWFSG